MVMGECSAYSSLQMDSKVVCRLAYELTATRRWPTFHSLRGTMVNCRLWLRAVNDSMVLCIIIIIIIIEIRPTLLLQSFNAKSRRMYYAYWDIHTMHCHYAVCTRFRCRCPPPRISVCPSASYPQLDTVAARRADLLIGQPRASRWHRINFRFTLRYVKERSGAGRRRVPRTICSACGPSRHCACVRWADSDRYVFSNRTATITILMPLIVADWSPPRTNYERPFSSNPYNPLITWCTMHVEPIHEVNI